VTIEEQIIAWLAAQGSAIYVVGGWVRDRLLGRRNYDLDFAVDGQGMALARRLADHFAGDYYALDEERDTGRAIVTGPDGKRRFVDVARLRGPDLAADLADRDFTINALAIDIKAPNVVIDHHHGRDDLEWELIRPVSDSSIRDDPVRALRAVRQAAQLGFSLTAETEALLRRDGAGLSTASGERICDELARLLVQPDAAAYLVLLDELGLLTVLFPALEPLRQLAQSPPHHLPVLAHSLKTVGALEQLLSSLQAGQPTPEPARLQPFAGRLQTHLEQTMSSTRPRLVTLKLAALLHDVGKAEAHSREPEGRIRFIGHPKQGKSQAAEILQGLRLSRAEVQLGETIIEHHMRPLLLAHEESVSSRAIYRFFRDTGDAGVDVLLHALADNRATYPPGSGDREQQRLEALAARMLQDYWEHRQERVAPPPLITGRDLLREFDLQPGPLIGQLLEAVREAQVSGEVRTREQALDLVKLRLAAP
jgi:tRNA nucleotidyltransferase/poly(A) polymerase